MRRGRTWSAGPATGTVKTTDGLFTCVLLTRWAAGLRSTEGDITSVAVEKGGMPLMTGVGRATD